MKERFSYYDCHVDTLTEIDENEDLWENRRNLDLERVNKFAENYIQIFAIWKNRTKIQPQCEEETFMWLYQRALSLLDAQRERIRLCRNGNEMQQALKENRAAAFLAVEDVSIMGQYVEQMKELGISVAMLTWNYENEYGAGAVANQKKGLTQKGKNLVDKLIHQQIVPDVSHLSDAGIEDVFLQTEHPVIASHSNVRNICDNLRNLLTEHIREIIRRQGIIGMNYYQPFVGRDERTGFLTLFRHMDYILEQGGEEALVLGSDFDGCDNHFVDGIHGIESIPKLREEMKNAGFDESLLNKIFWENGYHFWRKHT